jgi:hypothetical protein
MGYTTDFEGEFRCRRAVAPEIEAFLSDVESDIRVVGVLADWLEDQADERTVKLRSCTSHREAANIFHALVPEHAAYLLKLSETRRMRRDSTVAKTLPDPVREAAGLPIGEEACYFVGGSGFGGQDRDSSILDFNRPPKGQPGLWCKWIPNEDGSAIIWSGAEKFYDYVEWIEFLIEHFLGPWGYFLDGEMNWAGEYEGDRGRIRLRENIVTVTSLSGDVSVG